MNIRNLIALAILSLTLGACAIERHNSEKNPPPETPVAAVETPVAVTQQPAPASVEAPVVATPVAPTPAPVAHTPGVPAEKALGWLKNGNVRFLTHHLRKDGQFKKDIQVLAKGQHPHTIVLSCSDSRVPPELVFDQKLGEIFVIRTAGEDLDNAGIASIEYAIEHLGPELVVVMGHTSCGAVKAAIEVGDKDAGSPALNKLVHHIQPRLGDYQSRMPSSELADESWNEAKGVAKELAVKSAIVRARLEAGQLKIVTALYHTENGKVDFTP